jgi:membrane protein DedA with SNARE-associated domain
MDFWVYVAFGFLAWALILTIIGYISDKKGTK